MTLHDPNANYKRKCVICKKFIPDTDDHVLGDGQIYHQKCLDRKWPADEPQTQELELSYRPPTRKL